MTFRQLAFSNIRGSALRYAAFFLSSTFSVALFFVYAQFIMHPDVTGGYIYGGDGTRVVLLVCEVLVAVFAFFFVLYSSGAFLRARNQEFGLLTLMGTTRGQLRRLIWLENTILSFAAIALGICLGLLFSRLFLLGISRVLDLYEPIRFLFVPDAILLTAASFFALFQLVTLVGSFRLGRQEVVELMRAARKPRAAPRASVPLAVLGAALVVAGYAVALSVEGAGVVLAFVPVVTVVVLGTFLLFTHGSVKVLHMLRGARAGYLKGTRMLVVSQLLFRVRDNARLLATIATLSAVVLAAAGSFYVVNRGLEEGLAGMYPQELAFIEGATERPGLSPSELDAILARNAVAPSIRTSVRVHELRFRGPDAGAAGWLVLVGASDYAAFASATGFEVGAEGDATSLRMESGTAVLGDGGVAAVRVAPPVTMPPSLFGDWYVLQDSELARLPTAGREYAPATLWLYDWPEGAGGRWLEAELQRVTMAEAQRQEVEARFLGVRQIRQTLGLSMFAGVFVSLLFFIGAGSLIYFKLFTELGEDRRLHGRLRRLGVTPGESARVVTAQIAVIYLLPFALGALHAGFALDALGSLLMQDVTRYTLVVIGLFAAVQGAFFLLTRWTYLRALRPAG
jgi:putative ABC transport system permease protein